MGKEFNWKRFISSKDQIAIHCTSKKEAKDFCKNMHEHGMKWSSGKSYLNNTGWEKDNKYTCYTNDGCYGSVISCKDYDYIVLEWSDYMEKENEDLRELLKPCYVVEHRNGNLSLVVSIKGSNQDDAIGLCFFSGEWNGLYYDSNLIYNGRSLSHDEDIIRIYGLGLYGSKNSLFSLNDREVIWERPAGKSKAELKLEELEKKQREIADEIAKVKDLVS